MCPVTLWAPISTAHADIDRRHGDPGMGGLSSGEKVRQTCGHMCCHMAATHVTAPQAPSMGKATGDPATLLTPAMPLPAACLSPLQAAITRSERYGDELHFEKDAPPEKQEAIQQFKWVRSWETQLTPPDCPRHRCWFHIFPTMFPCREEQMGKSTPQNADARADDPLSNPKNREAQGNA